MNQPEQSTYRTWWQAITLRDIVLGTVVVMLVVLGMLLLVSLRYVLVSIFLGLLLATALRPVMAHLRGGNLPRFLAASLSVLLLVGLVAGFLLLVVPLLVAQVGVLQSELPGLYSSARAQLLASPIRLLRQIGGQLTEGVPAGTLLPNTALVSQVLGWLPSLGQGLFVAVSTLAFAYYWLLYRERSVAGLLLLLALERRERFREVWEQIEAQIGAFVRGQVLLALITGGLSLVAYWLAGVPYAPLLALIAAVLEFVPFLGPFLATLVAFVTGLSVSTEVGLVALGVGVAIQQIENLLVAPRIMAHSVGISPVVTMLAFIGFAALFGPLGGFLAIPLAASLQVLLFAWMTRNTATSVAAVDGRGTLDRLRYEAEDLADDIASHLRQRNSDETPASAATEAVELRIEQVLRDLRVLLAER